MSQPGEPKVTYNRVMLKISGEALMGDQGFGLHPPTMYFPLIVHEALMIEPCETESKETMDEVCGIYCKLFELAHSDPETLHTAPHSTPVRRLDEVGAARNMVLRYQFA